MLASRVGSMAARRASMGSSSPPPSTTRVPRAEKSDAEESTGMSKRLERQDGSICGKSKQDTARPVKRRPLPNQPSKLIQLNCFRHRLPPTVEFVGANPLFIP